MSFSETLRKAPDEAVIAWLVRDDAELALSTVTIAEIAYGIQKRPDQRADRLEQGLEDLATSFRGSDFRFDRGSGACLRGAYGRRCLAGTSHVGA
tara:strand:+ start:14145 stop:14429 length:285 start_codon:yes stop_codon:yes gene_type:complete